MASGNEASIGELAEMTDLMSEFKGFEISVLKSRFLPLPVNFYGSAIRISKRASLKSITPLNIKLKPTTGMRDALKKTIAYYRHSA